MIVQIPREVLIARTREACEILSDPNSTKTQRATARAFRKSQEDHPERLMAVPVLGAGKIDLKGRRSQ
jgi:hypothetical protein